MSEEQTPKKPQIEERIEVLFALVNNVIEGIEDLKEEVRDMRRLMSELLKRDAWHEERRLALEERIERKIGRVEDRTAKLETK